jgi:hypothetical protein
MCTVSVWRFPFRRRQCHRRRSGAPERLDGRSVQCIRVQRCRSQLEAAAMQRSGSGGGRCEAIRNVYYDFQSPAASRARSWRGLRRGSQRPAAWPLDVLIECRGYDRPRQDERTSRDDHSNHVGFAPDEPVPPDERRGPAGSRRSRPSRQSRRSRQGRVGGGHGSHGAGGGLVPTVRA